MFTRREIVGMSTVALAGLGSGCAPMAIRSAGAAAPTTSQAIDDLQERTFRFFWETTNPENGLTPDRWPTKTFSSIAAIGFALTAYPIGVAHGWITRAQARKRTLATLEFFAQARQGPDASGVTGYQGFFYHFLDLQSGERFQNIELSTIDTTLLLGGILFAQSWFDGDHPDEQRIRQLADDIYARVDWTWIRPDEPFVSMGWHPANGFIPANWDSFNEALLLYVLALGSPTHALEPEVWDHWTGRFNQQWGGKYGEPHVAFPALFVYQYSNMWIDFRGIRDRFSREKNFDYFENSRRATYAQRAYAIANPERWAGYGADIWGLTACDGPGSFSYDVAGSARQFEGYSARGVNGLDDGTIAPTAALGSIAFAPEIVLPVLTALRQRYGDGIYQRYGFLDSFNPSLTGSPPIHEGRMVEGVGWVDDDYLGIDQGPIVGGIENWRNGLIWKTMRRNPHIRRGLTRAGFTGGWLGT